MDSLLLQWWEGTGRKIYQIGNEGLVRTRNVKHSALRPGSARKKERDIVHVVGEINEWRSRGDEIYN